MQSFLFSAESLPPRERTGHLYHCKAPRSWRTCAFKGQSCFLEERPLCHQCRTHWWLSLVQRLAWSSHLRLGCPHWDAWIPLWPLFFLCSLFLGVRVKPHPLRAWCKLWDSILVVGELDLGACECWAETFQHSLLVWWWELTSVGKS